MSISMPRFWLWALVALGLFTSLTGQAKDDRTILVTGEGEAHIAPDQVEFVVGIDVTAAKVETCKTKSDEILRRILATTKDFKIDGKDVQSDYSRIQPIQESGYDPRGKPERPTISYNARRDVRILLRDITRYDDLLTALFNNGVNNLYSLNFKSSSLAKLEIEARSLAIKNAQAKADAMAQQMGLKLGRPRAISEGLREPVPPHSPAWARTTSANLAERSSDPTLAPGEIRVKQQVTVIFDAD